MLMILQKFGSVAMTANDTQKKPRERFSGLFLVQEMGLEPTQPVRARGF